MAAKRSANNSIGRAALEQRREPDADQVHLEKRWQTCREDRSEVDKCALEISGRYDQWILTLSGGGLAISIAYLEKIATQPSKNTLILLAFSWFFFIAAMLAALFGILYSQYSLHHKVKFIDAEYLAFLNGVSESGAMKEADVKQQKYVRRVDKLNRASAITFVVGVMFLCVFAFVNLPRGSAPPSDKKTGTNAFAALTNLSLPPIVPSNIVSKP